MIKKTTEAASSIFPNVLKDMSDRTAGNWTGGDEKVLKVRGQTKY